jgi:ABC-type cobalamin transport system ATPase subunit
MYLHAIVSILSKIGESVFMANKDFSLTLRGGNTIFYFLKIL